jgi:Ran GTPase-activating protein (RanGAP) involved in mRNA processing and transport
MMNKEAVQSLALVCQQFPQMIEQVNFMRNGIRDSEMGTLIAAFAELEKFTSLIIKHNDFLFKSWNSIQPILSRTMGNNLEELRLVSCRTSPQVMDSLLAHVAENCTLNKLGLVEAQLTNTHVEKLRNLIQRGRLLRELDISWNALGVRAMLDITKELAQNRTLTSVNLSWNYLTISQKGNKMLLGDPEFAQMVKDINGEPEVVPSR